ncbi:MAG: hypothetical protein K1060chlam3_00020, partial [Candidatus Anoxychlamydiales bacterium]|nr:hypothetical protein [Candidatus Anoxychlamydiales bacterium]
PASRIIGAYKYHLKNNKMAEAITNELELYGMIVKPKNPFKSSAIIKSVKQISIYADRIIGFWQLHRETVIKNFPKPSIRNKIKLLNKIDDLYTFDAYNSLSIEGYQVTIELIKQAQLNKVPLEKNALAAKGYSKAFLEAKKSIAKMITTKKPGSVFEKDLQKWHINLFAPQMQANLLSERHLLGYRSSQVYIRNSRHVPPPKEALMDSMDALFYCLKNEKNAAVRAILGHYMFVYIHPYIDGNGRIARLLMNSMFLSGGYSWTIVHEKNRDEYLNCLETITADQNFLPFVLFLKEEQNREHL